LISLSGLFIASPQIPLPLPIGRISDILPVQQPIFLDCSLIIRVQAMSFTRATVYSAAVKSFAILLLTTVAACQGDANPVRDAVVSSGFGPTRAATPDFVAQSRPGSLDYVPVGTSAPARAMPARTSDEVKAAEAEMDALRARNESAGQAAVRAGATPAPAPLKPLVQ
jgi:hypothetical protein